MDLLWALTKTYVAGYTQPTTWFIVNTWHISCSLIINSQLIMGCSYSTVRFSRKNDQVTYSKKDNFYSVKSKYWKRKEQGK